MAEFLELADRAAFGPDGLDPGVVVGAEVVVERSGLAMCQIATRMVCWTATRALPLLRRAARRR